jgi:hypothetical protein
MEGVVGNPTATHSGPPAPLARALLGRSKSSLGYDIAKNMGIAILSTVTGVITTFSSACCGNT